MPRIYYCQDQVTYFQSLFLYILAYASRPEEFVLSNLLPHSPILVINEDVWTSLPTEILLHVLEETA